MSGFTKGPWSNEGEDIVAPDVPNIVISAENEDGLGRIEVCSVSSFLDDEKDEFIITDKVKANANLIAAAPEMYEALMAIGDNVSDVIEQMQIGEWKDSHGHDVCLNESMLRFIENLNKALVVTKKARGES